MDVKKTLSDRARHPAESEITMIQRMEIMKALLFLAALMVSVLFPTHSAADIKVTDLRPKVNQTDLASLVKWTANEVEIELLSYCMVTYLEWPEYVPWPQMHCNEYLSVYPVRNGRDEHPDQTPLKRRERALQKVNWESYVTVVIPDARGHKAMSPRDDRVLDLISSKGGPDPVIFLAYPDQPVVAGPKGRVPDDANPTMATGGFRLQGFQRLLGETRAHSYDQKHKVYLFWAGVTLLVVFGFLGGAVLVVRRYLLKPDVSEV